MDEIPQLLVAERARRVQVERELSEARATIAALQMQLASIRRPGQVISDCSELSGGGNINKTKKSSGGIKKKKSKERTPKAKIPGQSRYWTPEEHKLFLEALRKFGHKDLRNISAYVGTRNMTQCRTHSQKYFMRLMREAKRQNPAITNPAVQIHDNTTTDGDNDSPVSSGDSTGVTVASNNVSGNMVSDKRIIENDANSDKYSVPNTCGMTLLCLVGQDTLTNWALGYSVLCPAHLVSRCSTCFCALRVEVGHNLQASEIVRVFVCARKVTATRSQSL